MTKARLAPGKPKVRVQQELTQKQKDILEVFDKILQISMSLFQIDDMKMQSIICGQFTQY